VQIKKWLRSKNEAYFEKYVNLTLTAAKELAKYQSPTFRAVALAPAPVTRTRVVAERTDRTWQSRIVRPR
jgi:hypothetical protein